MYRNLKMVSQVIYVEFQVHSVNYSILACIWWPCVVAIHFSHSAIDTGVIEYIGLALGHWANCHRWNWNCGDGQAFMIETH